METVGIQIERFVEHIKARHDQTETEKRRERGQNAAEIGHGASGNDGNKYQEILDPLIDPFTFDRRQQTIGWAREAGLDGDRHPAAGCRAGHAHAAA